MSLDSVIRIARELEVQIDVMPRWRAEGLARLLDEAHAGIVEALVRRYSAGGWQVAVEVSFAIGGERGSVDVLAFHPASRIVAVNEVKSIVPDVQATIHGIDRKARLARTIASERGWNPVAVSRYLVIGEDRTARRRVAQHEALFAAAFPVRGRDALASIDRPGTAVSGLLFLSADRQVQVARTRGGRFRVRRGGPAGSALGASPARSSD